MTAAGSPRAASRSLASRDRSSRRWLRRAAGTVAQFLVRKGDKAQCALRADVRQGPAQFEQSGNCRGVVVGAGGILMRIVVSAHDAASKFGHDIAKHLLARSEGLQMGRIARFPESGFAIHCRFVEALAMVDISRADGASKHIDVAAEPLLPALPRVRRESIMRIGLSEQGSWFQPGSLSALLRTPTESCTSTTNGACAR